MPLQLFCDYESSRIFAGSPREGARRPVISMLVVHVHVRVKPECVEAFKQATIENARHSLKEAGIACFDIHQRQDDPTRFVLIEGYRDADAPARHKETAHYAKWRDAVAPMMAEPRSSLKYERVDQNPS